MLIALAKRINTNGVETNIQSIYKTLYSYLSLSVFIFFQVIQVPFQISCSVKNVKMKFQGWEILLKSNSVKKYDY